jgi:hypothetical protein
VSKLLPVSLFKKHCNEHLQAGSNLHIFQLVFCFDLIGLLQQTYEQFLTQAFQKAIVPRAVSTNPKSSALIVLAIISSLISLLEDKNSTLYRFNSN